MFRGSLPVPQRSIHHIYDLYVAVGLTGDLDAERGLGGQLLYAGDLALDGGNLLFAANIAGAATLAASADAAMQRQAMRDGAVDFLVTSLSEALRVLKNEIRKRQPVSVGVAIEPDRLVEQMLDRGVLPDLLPAAIADLRDGAGKFLNQGARAIRSAQAPSGAFVTWSVDREFARWLPRLDGCAQSVIPEGDLVRRRWLRLAPRYLGRMAQRTRGVALEAAEAARFSAAAEELIAGSGEGARLEIRFGTTA